MPYSGPSDPKLPEHVAKLSAALRSRWIEVFNDTLDRTDDKGEAMRAANAVLEDAAEACAGLCFASHRVTFGDGEPDPDGTWIQIAKRGDFIHWSGKRLNITKAWLASFVNNFAVLGGRIPGKIGHPQLRARMGERVDAVDFRKIATTVELREDGDILEGRTVWTDEGKKLVTSGAMDEVSAEIVPDYTDEHGKHHGPTVTAWGLLVEPFLKGMRPALAAQSNGPDAGPKGPIMLEKIMGLLGVESEDAIEDAIRKLQAAAKGAEKGAEKAEDADDTTPAGSAENTSALEARVEALATGLAAANRTIIELTNAQTKDTIDREIKGLRAAGKVTDKNETQARAMLAANHTDAVAFFETVAPVVELGEVGSTDGRKPDPEPDVSRMTPQDASSELERRIDKRMAEDKCDRDAAEAIVFGGCRALYQLAYC